jgi:hypothetical protein
MKHAFAEYRYMVTVGGIELVKVYAHRDGTLSLKINGYACRVPEKSVNRSFYRTEEEAQARLDTP